MACVALQFPFSSLAQTIEQAIARDQRTPPNKIPGGLQTLRRFICFATRLAFPFVTRWSGYPFAVDMCLLEPHRS